MSSLNAISKYLLLPNVGAEGTKFSKFFLKIESFSYIFFIFNHHFLKFQKNMEFLWQIHLGIWQNPKNIRDLPYLQGNL
jgi:hypothetical protein